MILSLLVIALGFLVALAWDCDFNPAAYALGAAGVVGQACHRLLVQVITQDGPAQYSTTHASSSLQATLKQDTRALLMEVDYLKFLPQVLFVISVINLPFFVLLSALFGEPAGALEYFGRSGGTGPEFLASFSALMAIGALLQFGQLLCIAVSSAVTTSVVSIGKSVIQVQGAAGRSPE